MSEKQRTTKLVVVLWVRKSPTNPLVDQTFTEIDAHDLELILCSLTAEVGTYVGGMATFEGYLSHLCLWNRVLELTEIQVSLGRVTLCDTSPLEFGFESNHWLSFSLWLACIRGPLAIQNNWCCEHNACCTE